MPCISEQSPPPYYNKPKKVKNKTDDNLEILLCSACRALESAQFDFDINPPLSVWWSEHKKKDEARKDKELKLKLNKEFARNLIGTKKIGDLSSQELKLLKSLGYLQ